MGQRFELMYVIALSTDKIPKPSGNLDLIIRHLEYVSNGALIIALRFQKDPSRIESWGSEIDKILSVGNLKDPKHRK